MTDTPAPPPLPVVQAPRRSRRVLVGLALLLGLFLLGLTLFVRALSLRAYYIPSASMRPTLNRGDRFIVDRGAYRKQAPKRGDIIVFRAPPEATDGGEEGVEFVMRVVGQPGETVAVRAAELRVGDEVVGASDYSGTPHDYLRAHLHLGDEESVKLFPDHILVGTTRRRVEKAEIARALGRADIRVTITPGRTLVNGQPLSEPFTAEDPAYNLRPTRLGKAELFVLGDNRNQARDSHIWGPLKRDRVVGRATDFRY